MIEIVNLQKYKEDKLNKKIIKDVTNIIIILEKCQKELTEFSNKYKSVQEIYSVIETNRVLLNIQKKKYEANSTPGKS
jgi:hypothetical protein